jgi:hypothetical protein
MMAADSAAALLELLARARRALGRLPQVAGVGLGWREKCGEITDIPALRVYVRQKVARAELSQSDIVPAYYDGVLTDVVPVFTVVPAFATVAAMQHSSRAPLQPGITISNLRGMLPEQAAGPHQSGMGTLGFFALVNGIRRREVVLVSNRHVLMAHGAGSGSTIYAPVFCRRGENSLVHASTLDPIAEIKDEGAEQNHPFHYNDEPVENYFVDCATALLLAQPASPTGNNGVPAPVVRGVARMHPLDALGYRAPRVRKFGGTSGITQGRVVDVAAPVENSSGPQRQQNIVIRGTDGAFVWPGDSGALVLNEHDQAIGMVWGRSDHDPNLAYACHIHPVLDRLGVTLMYGGMA